MMKSKQIKCCMTLVLLLLAISHTLTVYAGSVNGNEQQVIGTARGRFEKDGVVYQVKQEYIDSLVSYLSQDDVDLTAEDCQAAIAEIYANVSTGVESGYLTPVGKTEAPSVSASPSNGNAWKDGAGKTATKTETDMKTETSPAEENIGDSEAPQSGKDSLAIVSRASKAVKPLAIIGLESFSKIGSGEQVDMGRDTAAFMEKVKLPAGEIICLLAALALILAVTAGFSSYKKLFKKHHGNTAARNGVRIILTSVIAVLALLVQVLLTLWMGAFHKTPVLNNIAKTDYYQTVYDTLKRDTSLSFGVLGIPNEVMNHSLTYERIVLTAKQQAENDLVQGDYKANTSLLTNQLREDIEASLTEQSVQLTPEAQSGLRALIQRLDNKYVSLLQWPFGPWWLQLSRQFYRILIFALPCAVLLSVCSHIHLAALYHFKHRAVRLCGVGQLAASVIMLTACAAIKLSGWEPASWVKPGYMRAFFDSYLEGILWIGIMIGGIGILLAIGYFLLAKTMKEGSK